jgi:hypothetical protein
MKQERALSKERVLDLLNSLRGSFVSFFAKLTNDLADGIPVEIVLHELSGVLAKIDRTLTYALQHGKFEEAEKLIAGIDLTIDEFIACELDIAGFHERVDELISKILGSPA